MSYKLIECTILVLLLTIIGNTTVSAYRNPASIQSFKIKTLKLRLRSTPIPAQSTLYVTANRTSTNMPSIFEDSAKFSLSEQSIEKWMSFTAAVAAVLGVVYGAWIWEGGPKLGDRFKNSMEELAGHDSTATIVLMLGLFGVIHSGMAALRPNAEEIIGPRAWRVIFALFSLPIAFSSIVYFINHSNDGVQLWDVKSVPGVQSFVFLTSLISFFFLYPGTFNLLEVAAIDEPKLHLWDTGIIRITRHPQMVGQILWCLAHSLYIGTSFTLAASTMLCMHHLFAVWNGDVKLKQKFGHNADEYFNRTSIIPFQAILSGKQKLPDDYYKEFLRVPYVTVLVGTIVAYLSSPHVRAKAALTKW